MKKFKQCVFMGFIAVCLSACISCADEQFVYQPSGKRDPLMPLVTPQGLVRDLDSLDSEGGFILEGIIYDEKQGRSFAIINGEVAKAGDEIGSATVLEISKNKVIILSEGQTLEISLEEKEEE